MYAAPGIGVGGWAPSVVCCLAIFGRMKAMVWGVFGVDPRTIPGRMRQIVAGTRG